MSPYRFSSTSAAKPAAAPSDSNFFLDNLGKIFLLVIATIIGTLIRGSYNTSNRNAVRDNLEDTAALDPVEIEELRIANSELSVDVFRKIMQDLIAQFPQGSSSYTDFVHCVRKTMSQMKGPAFTVELGHMLDRAVVALLNQRGKSTEDEMPLSLWLATLTLALNSPISDRIQILYEIMELENNPVTFIQIRSMVGYLQETCQLVPDSQIVATDVRFPTQQWRRGKPEDLVPWDGMHTDRVDTEAFASILRSKSVCAWGECYHKKKFGPGE